MRIIQSIDCWSNRWTFFILYWRFEWRLFKCMEKINEHFGSWLILLQCYCPHSAGVHSIPGSTWEHLASLGGVVVVHTWGQGWRSIGARLKWNIFWQPTRPQSHKVKTKKSNGLEESANRNMIGRYLDLCKYCSLFGSRGRSKKKTPNFFFSSWTLITYCGYRTEQ